MDQPQMDVADLHVKLANGGLVRALGLLRNLKVKIPYHYVYHTFAIMDFNDKPGSFEMILGRSFMRKHKMIHDRSNNNVYLNLKDEHVRVNLGLGKAHPLAHGEYFRAYSNTTVFTKSDPTTSVNYCKTCKKETDLRSEDYIHDDDPIYDKNWCHLLATMDVWEKREITCVMTNGTPLSKVIPLNVLSIIHATDTDDFDNLSLSSSPSSSSSDEDSQCSSTTRKWSFRG